MILKRTISILFVLCNHLQTQAQKTPPVNEQLTLIDSLIEYTQLYKAEKKIDSLYSFLNTKENRKHYLEEIQEVRLRKARILDEREDNAKALTLLFNISDIAESHNFYNVAGEAYLKTALVFEKADNLQMCNQYLSKALKVISEKGLDSLYYTYYIRRASYYRYTKNIDSSKYCAYQAREYAKKNKNEHDLAEAHLMIGILLGKYEKDSIATSNENFNYALRYHLKVNKYESAIHMYYNIAMNYMEDGNIEQAFLYNDSAYAYYKNTLTPGFYAIPKQRSILFDRIGNTDSAYRYYKLFHLAMIRDLMREEITNVKKIEEKHENDQKEVIIKNKNQQLALIVIIALLVTVSTVLLYLQNIKIRNKNKLIHQQLEELKKLLEQKSVLLAELQHRVKNNLQQVVSILEIQKESINFNNVEELIRENQNRIHSMALLHKKLNVSDKINSVDICAYIEELSKLVSDSYYSHQQEIIIETQCDFDEILIETALPLGMLIVELVSNSIKHAFKGKAEGNITIALTRDEYRNKSKLYYADDGKGFDFIQEHSEGLGLEIIKGLIEQLNGLAEAKQDKGFELTIYF